MRILKLKVVFYQIIFIDRFKSKYYFFIGESYYNFFNYSLIINLLIVIKF